MPNYNPTATETLGPEVHARGWRVQTVNSALTAAALSVMSLAAETINEVRLYLNKVDIGGTFVVDVYPTLTAEGLYAGSLDGSFLQTTYNPNEDVTVTNITGVTNNTAAQRYQNIDEGTLAYSTADYIRPTTTGVATQYEGRVGSGAFAGRPVSVTIRFVVDQTAPDAVETFRVALNIGGTLYDQATADATTIGLISGIKTVTQSVTWLKNPSTGLPWTVAAIQAFDTADEVSFQWYAGNPNTATHLVAYDMIVESDTETRVATGSAVLATTSAAGWQAFPIQAIAGGNWSKANATAYTYVLRRVSASGSCQWSGPYLPDVTVTNFMGYAPSLVNGVPGWPSGVFYNKSFQWQGLIIRTSAPADSADSQVYWGILTEQVKTGLTATGEFSNAAVKTYGIITMMIKYAGVVNQPLTVKLKRRSDNVQMGSTFTISKAEIDALPDQGDGWKIYRSQMASSVTLAAVQYYWEFTSTATVGYWLVPFLSTGNQGNALSFGGTTDRGTVLGAEQDYVDVDATLATIPTAPGSFAVALANQTVTTDGSGATVNTIQYANITWSATSLAALFSYYEIQRTEDAGTTWNTIAVITAEATVAFKDFEGLRNTVCGYRMRVFRLDGAFSLWTSTVNVTPAALAVDTWSFVSNQANSENCIFYKVGGADYVFPDAGEVELHPVYGSNYYVALQPTEDRGVQVELTVVVSTLSSFNRGSNPLGWAVFNRLRTLARDPNLNYVCVHDPYCNRVLAKLRVPNGPYATPNVYWTAIIQVAQITSTFSTPAA